MIELYTQEFYKNFHLTWDFSGKPWRESLDDKFNISYGKCTRRPQDFRSEVVNTVKYLKEIATMPLAVLYSGGVDSELVCRALHDAGIDFTAITFVYNNDLNVHESKFAEAACKKYKWKQVTVNFDLIKWFQEDMHPMAEKYRIKYPEVSVHTKMLSIVNEMGYFPIDCRGDINLINENNEIVWYETEESLVPTKYLQENGMEGCPRFFKYSPELIYSWLTNDMVLRWKRYNIPLKMPQLHNFKTIVYHDSWPDLPPREKYTGYEFALKEYRIQRDKLNQHKFINAKVRMEYDQVVNYMWRD